VPAALYGPDTAAPAWLEGYVARQGPGLAALAQHFYPLGRCHAGRLLAAGPSPASLLSRKVALHEVRRIGELARLAARHGLPLRIDEANSVSCAGQPHTSDTFAAALWAVDFSLIAAHEGVIGVNFHGGTSTQFPLAYSPIVFNGLTPTGVQAVYYGELLWRLAGTGSLHAATVAGAADVAAWGIGNNVVVNNKSASVLTVTVKLTAAAATARGYVLTGPSMTSKTVTVAGSAVSASGAFHPSPQALRVSGRTVTLSVPAHSAVLVVTT